VKPALSFKLTPRDPEDEFNFERPYELDISIAVPFISPKLGTHDGNNVPDNSSYSPVLVPKLLKFLSSINI
jgi:hypothetical protein